MTKVSPRRGTARVSLLGLTFLGALTFSFTTPAPAEATHPLVQPPVLIKLNLLNLPFALNQVTQKKMSGLDLEDKKVRSHALAKAKEYVEIRRGIWDRARVEAWLDTCEKSLGKASLSPYCKSELERTRDDEPTRLPSEIRAERQDLAEKIRSGEFAKLEGKSYPDVALALSQVGEASQIRPLAERVAKTKACAPSNLTSAMGYKLEELFPESDAIELAKSLYKKSSECGHDFGAGQAAFRLGLISVWQNKCGDAETAMKKVEAIPEASQFHARAKYWRYHCASVAKNEKAKTEMREALISQHPMSFQNLAVNGGDDAMMDRVMRSNEPQNVIVRSVVRPDLNEVVRAAEALERIGEPTLAGEFLDRSVSDLNTMEPEVRLYVAALLDRMKISLTKFKVMSSLFQDAPRLVSRETMRMMFPLQFAEIVRQQAKDIDPLLILSLMRQESAFNSQAVSLVGARGLMQVMPATARSIASVRAHRLFDPKTNVGVGTKYLNKRLMQYRGDVELTLAAYNAGAGRVDRWTKRYTTDNKMLFLDFIPFKETREYVSSILRNYYWYVRLYGPIDTKAAKVETEKVQVASPAAKVQAIMAANAGLVAWQAPEVQD